MELIHPKMCFRIALNVLKIRAYLRTLILMIRVKAAVTEIGRLPAEQLVSDDEDFLLTIKAIRFFPDYHIEVEQVDGSRMEMELKPCWPEKEKRKK